MSEVLPISTLEIPNNLPDLEILLVAARALWRACGDSDSWDKVREHRQAISDMNRLLDHYPDGIHRDEDAQPTIEFEAVV